MFFRIKAALFAVLIVAAATVGGASYVTKALRDRTIQRVEEDVTRAQQVLLRQSRLEGFDLANLAASFAREDGLVQIFSKPTIQEQQAAAYVEAEVRKARVEKKPDGDDRADRMKVGILGVVDAKGALLARDLQPNWRRGDVLTAEFPSLDAALKGATNKDIWNLDGAMYRVGAAPIRGPTGNVLGAVFIGFVQSTTDAKAAEELLGTEVAYFLDGKIHASSFDHRDRGSESAEEKALGAELFEGPNVADAVRERRPTLTFHITVNRTEWVAAAAPLPGNATQSKSGFVVLQSLRQEQAHIAPITGVIYGLGALAVLMVLLAWQLRVRRFLVPLDRVEAGVSEVINGNQDYVFEAASSDFEGLANLLNGMLAKLLGRPEPEDEDVEEEDRVTKSVVDMQ